MDDFDDLMPRTSAAQPRGDREKRGAERPAADAATPDVYEAVQAARGSAAGGSSRPPRRQTSKTRAKIGDRAPVKARGDVPPKDLDVPATVSALAIGAVVGFLIGFFSAKGGK